MNQKTEKTLAEFQQEQKELDALLMAAAIEEDQKAHKEEKEKQGIYTQSEICLFCNLYELFSKYAEDKS